MWLQMATGVNNGSYFVLFYKPNTTNPLFPGDILEGTPALGQNVTFKVSSQVSTYFSGSVINEVVGSVTPFNLSAGTYFISAAGYIPNTAPTSSGWQFAGWDDSSVYLPGYNGLNATGSRNPFIGDDPTFSWTNASATRICLWFVPILAPCSAYYPKKKNSAYGLGVLVLV
jgi:hypothetical protein